MKNLKFYAVVLAVLFSAVVLKAQTVNLKGAVGESKLQMSLNRDGDQLSGSYFYDKQGSANKLNLIGTIDAAGNFTLEEKDATGKLTGTFKGTWKNDETNFGITLEGNWQKPKGGADVGFYAYEQNVNFTGNLAFVTRKVSENNKFKLYEMNGEYPEITGETAPNNAKFNLLVKQRVTKSLAEFKKDMLTQTAEDLKFARERGVSNYIEIGFDSTYATNDLVSIQFSESTFSGGAHPNSSTYTINYDLKNGRALTLADLFQPKSNYLKALSNYCIADLKKQVEEMSDDEWLTRGAGADAENFRSWNITKKGLMINFDPYQVAAYAAGPQTVIIPYAKLQEIAKTSAVVSALQK